MPDRFDAALFDLSVTCQNLPLGQILMLRTEIDANQDDLFAAAAVSVGIAFVVNLLNRSISALVTLEFDDADGIGEKHSQVNPAFAGQHAAAGIGAGGRYHQIKQGVERGFIALRFNVVWNCGKNGGHGLKECLEIVVSQIACQPEHM
jgi:hypothetical protein